MLISFLSRTQISDSQTGYRAFSRKALEALNLSSNGYEIETEMVMKAARLGFRIKDVPITYRRRRGTPSKLNAFRAGALILKTIIEFATSSGVYQ